MPQRLIFTAAVLKALRANTKVPEVDRKPVLKVFNPYGAATWLLSELDEDGDTLFGLCDLGQGQAELGRVSLTEIVGTEVGRYKLPLERDAYFTATHTLAVYTAAAVTAGRIVEGRRELDAAAGGAP